MGINRVVVEEVALGVKANHLAARAESWVNAHDALLAQRGSQEELAQVVGKDANGLFVGPRLALGGKFGFDAGAEQALVGIRHGHLHLGSGRRTAAHVGTGQALEAALLVVGRDADAQESLGLAAADGQQAVGGASAEWLAPVEIVAILLRFGRLGLHHFGGDDGETLIGGAQGVARVFVLVDALGQDVARPLQSRFLIGHFGCQETAGGAHRVLVGLRLEEVGEGFEAQAAGCLGARLALGLEGQVDVLQHGGVPAIGKARLEFGRHLALLGDGVGDKLAAVLHLKEAFVLVLDGRHLHLVHTARCLLAVTADEGDGGTAF